MHPGNRMAGTWKIRCTAHLGQCAHQALGRLSCSDLGRAQNTCPTESVPLWSTREPEPEQLRPGKYMNPGPTLESSPAKQPEAEQHRSEKCTQPRAHLRQFPSRTTWNLSSVDRESIHTVNGVNPPWSSHCGHSPHTPVIFVCSVHPSPEHN